MFRILQREVPLGQAPLIVASITLVLTLAAFATDPPQVTAIYPNSGPITGGTAVTITGTGFQDGATITIGGALATNVQFVSDTKLEATTPNAAKPGSATVSVTNPDNQSGSLGSPIQLLSNPGFESGMANWKFTGPGTGSVQVGPGAPHSGSNYLELTSDRGNHPKMSAADAFNNLAFFSVSP